jgi:hypothetical protein
MLVSIRVTVTFGEKAQVVWEFQLDLRPQVTITLAAEQTPILKNKFFGDDYALSTIKPVSAIY